MVGWYILPFRRFKYVEQEELKVATDLHSSLENVHELRKNGQTNNHVNNINNANNVSVSSVKLLSFFVFIETCVWKIYVFVHIIL